MNHVVATFSTDILRRKIRENAMVFDHMDGIFYAIYYPSPQRGNKDYTCMCRSLEKRKGLEKREAEQKLFLDFWLYYLLRIKTGLA
jgi:hypothetical protein